MANEYHHSDGLYRLYQENKEKAFLSSLWMVHKYILHTKKHPEDRHMVFDVIVFWYELEALMIIVSPIAFPYILWLQNKEVDWTFWIILNSVIYGSVIIYYLVKKFIFTFPRLSFIIACGLFVIGTLFLKSL